MCCCFLLYSQVTGTVLRTRCGRGTARRLLRSLLVPLRNLPLVMGRRGRDLLSDTSTTFRSGAAAAALVEEAAGALESGSLACLPLQALPSSKLRYKLVGMQCNGSGQGLAQLERRARDQAGSAARGRLALFSGEVDAG
mmetsp:Transcript_16608/g.32169  ORF Transcript_16608/g.32169 Transcript_16608/m.32169 type:complete len:139 (+) Transcript_16608:3156-3572(+)